MKTPTTNPDFDPGIKPYGSVKQTKVHYEVHQLDARGTGLSAGWHQSSATNTIMKEFGSQAEAEALLEQIADTHPGLALRVVRVVVESTITTMRYQPPAV